MNNCFSAPTAEPPQWGKGASNYSGVGIFKFLFLKRRAMLVPWGAVRVGLGWGLEVSFGLPGFCVCVGGVGVFFCPYWPDGGPHREGAIAGWASLQLQGLWRGSWEGPVREKGGWDP